MDNLSIEIVSHHFSNLLPIRNPNKRETLPARIIHTELAETKIVKKTTFNTMFIKKTNHPGYLQENKRLTTKLETKPNLKRKALGYFRPACQQLQPQRASKGSGPGYNKPRYKQSNTQQRRRGRCKPSPSTCTRVQSDPERRSAGRARGERGGH